jgi:hypothetical protein
MGGLTPGLGRVIGKSWSIPRTHVGLCLVWETFGRCFRLNDRSVLNTWSLIRPGPFWGRLWIFFLGGSGRGRGNSRSKY